MIEKYEHQMIHILGYKNLCSREDVFALIEDIYESLSEEEYFVRVKRFITFVKLIAPQVLELYEIENRIITAKGLFGAAYYLHIPLADLVDRQYKVRDECDEFC